MKTIIKNVKTLFPNFLNFSILFLSFENASGLNAIKKPIIPEIATTKHTIKSNITIRLLIMIVVKSNLKAFPKLQIYGISSITLNQI
jgi:hypothetical protein